MRYIFYQNRKIVFVSTKKPIEVCTDALIVVYHDMPQLLKQCIRFLRKSSLSSLYIQCPEKTTEVFKNFIQQFDTIKAAGGIVRCPDEKLLYIYRYEHWDLPKGKKEKGEKTKDAAIREVQEETGVKNIEILRKLPNTYHFILKKQNIYIKKCSWFEMACPEEEDLQPQIQEDIQQAVWLSRTDVLERLPLMYASIAELSLRYFSV